MNDLERQILACEAQTWRFQGAKEEHILVKLGLTWTRYCQMLNRIIDDPTALAVDPVTVNRLRRLRDARRVSRRPV